MTQTNLKMIKKLIISILLLTTFFGYTQKKELRNAEKRLDEGFYNEALDILSQIEGIISSSDQKYQAHYYYLLGWANKGDTNFNEAVSLLRKSIEFITAAIEESEAKEFIESSKKLYMAYTIDNASPNQRYLLGGMRLMV